MGLIQSSKFFIFSVLITLLGMSCDLNLLKAQHDGADAIAYANNNGNGGNTCNFIKACDAGTHEDYSLCECVKDKCDGSTVKCAGGFEFDLNTCACEPVKCPDYACANPPAGCHYDPVRMPNGCVNACGTLVCVPKDPADCPAPPACAPPPQGCTFQPTYDVNGCIVGCGSFCLDDGGGS